MIRLREVEENLVGNAWKFSAGNQQSRLEIGKFKQQGKTVFFVRDNRVGISAGNCSVHSKDFIPIKISRAPALAFPSS